VRRPVKKIARIFIISGPSGSGKTTLVKNLLKDGGLKKTLSRSVSLSTRPRRSQERQGRDYFFIDEKQFKRKLRSRTILEWTKYLGYFYATPRDFIERRLRSGKHIILCLDYKGMLRVKQAYPDNTVTVFVMPPSIRALMRRIKKRCDKTRDSEIRQRLKLARQELLSADRYDYCLVNKNLQQATGTLKKVILKEIS